MRLQPEHRVKKCVSLCARTKWEKGMSVSQNLAGEKNKAAARRGRSFNSRVYFVGWERGSRMEVETSSVRKWRFFIWLFLILSIKLHHIRQTHVY